MKKDPFRAGCLALAACLLAAYWPALSAPFLYDDFRDIVQNQSIRSVFPLSGTLFPPMHAGTAGRPLSNLVLAFCYALFGEGPAGYHALGLLLHFLTVALVFSLVRRLAKNEAAPGGNGDLFAFFCALGYGLHPLATNSVAPCFRLPDTLSASLVLSAFLLGLKSGESRLRQAGAGLCFCLAVCAKQDAAVLPLVFILAEWVFQGRGPGAAARKKPVLFAGFVAGWALLAAVMVHAGTLSRAGTFSPFSPLVYAAGQPRAVFLYLQRILFPAGLCFDYHMQAAHGAALWGAALLVPAAAAAWAAARRLPAGFWALWFFLFLAPSSSVVPLNDLVNENRVYLAMAGPVVLAFTAAAWACGRVFAGRGARVFTALAAVACLALGAATFARVLVLADPVLLWRDTAEKRPDNFMAHFAYAAARTAAGDFSGAEQSYERTLALAPDFAPAHNNLGGLLLNLGKTGEAFAHLRRSLALRPESAQAENSLGWALSQAGEAEEGLRHLSRAVALSPDFVEARVNLGVTLWRAGDPGGAFAQLSRARELRPGDPGIEGLLQRLRAGGEAPGPRE